MKKTWAHILLEIIVLILFSTSSWAVPHKIAFQGYLRDAGGLPVTGTLQMNFAIYDQEGDGASLWDETQDVVVSRGVYHVTLGRITPITLPFDVTYWLGIAVGADSEMTPRQELTSVGYAKTTEYAESSGDARTLAGMSAAALDQSAHAGSTANPHAVTAAQAGAAAASHLHAYAAVTHPHAGEDIAAGVIGEPHIDQAIARSNQIIPTVLGADGAGSTLNADLLDDLHASDIVAAAAVKSPIDSCQTIDQAGSYYLTGNLTSSSTTCITVAADHVTIDLMGFTLTGSGLGTDDGIYLDGVSNVEIRNGTVRNFLGGIYANNPSTENSIRIIGIRAAGNTDSGIQLNTTGNLVLDCTVSANGEFGIYAEGGSTITHSTAYDNQNSGIRAGFGSVVSDNVSYGNQKDGIYALASTITGNNVYGNQWDGVYAGNGSVVSETSAVNNQGNGIFVGTGSTVSNNTVYNNNLNDDPSFAGLYINVATMVTGNTLRNNRQRNIWVGGETNAIENNLMTGSTYGIQFGASGNFFANNRSAGTTTAGYELGVTTQTDGGGNVAF